MINNGFNCTGNSVAALADGKFAACGSSIVDNAFKDVFVCKFDINGDTIFTKTIGGEYDDEGYCINATADGGFIIAGYTKSYGNGFADFFLVRLDADGAILWTRTNGGSLSEGSYSVLQTNKLHPMLFVITPGSMGHRM